MQFFILVVVWMAFWGTLGGLIGIMRKGRTWEDAIGIGALFGFFGVIYLALLPNAPSHVDTAPPVVDKSE